MNPVPLRLSSLPRSDLLTDALLAPPAARPSTEGLARARAQLQQRLRSPAGHIGATAVRVDRFLVHQARLRPDRLAQPDPFSWSAATAARTIGVAVARAALHEQIAGLVHQAHDVVGRLAHHGGSDSPRSLGRWLRDLPPAARAVVCAEAVNWATRLLAALNWPRLGPSVEVGGPDRWWDCPTAPQVALRSRVEVRVGFPPADGARATRPPRDPEPGGCTVLCLANGYPVASSGDELAVVALADALARPRGPHPSRVLGWWPLSGRALVLDVDDEVLARGAAAAIDAVEAVVRSREVRRAA